MPKVVIHKDGQTFTGELKENSNLVVRAGIKQFPYPHFSYRCGMGKCSQCASKILVGAENLPPPNWKEQKILGSQLEAGWRLPCQLWLQHDLELTQEGFVRDPTTLER